MTTSKTKSCNKKATWTKRIVLGLLILTAVLDFLSFAIHPEYWDFDMSALVLLTNNILIIFLVKFLVIGALCYMLLRKQSTDYFNFLWIMCAVYLILFQFVGFVANREVAEQAPPPEAAPSEEVRLNTGINFALIWGYFPIAFSMLSFWLWRFGWMDIK